MALIADVFDVIVKSKATGDVIGTTTLSEAGIEVSVQENEVRAGKGNALIATLHVSRDIQINLTDMQFRYDWLAAQLGQDIKTGAGVAYSMPKWYTVATESSNKVITLDNAPTNIDSLVIYDASGAKLVKTTDFTLSTNKVTILKAGIAAGTKVEVRTYTYATPANTQTIMIDNSVFAKGVEVILETVEIDSTENITARLQYQFTSAVPSGNFTVSTQSERNAASQTFNMKVVKPEDSTVVGQVVRIPVGA
ncbi:hypothetical protein F4V43_02555 [Paenibacillus spiritus]|uniref:Uncharacterized protein n=1 Tax=Paenibacillus spiritus TaxID=2496557 RepID=A0A5J5GI76_9BACL|nr:hypothetical protein [Paenibacillus spiritus]KAA9007388.1 hypothetical protein F4V43_02555 [Paenibacillus spiritus]